MKAMKSFLSTLFPQRKKPRYFIDSRSFDPDQHSDEAHILFARDEADNIAKRVAASASCDATVIVVDGGSSDGTAFAAAEAGAVVILKDANLPSEVGILEAEQLASRIKRNARAANTLHPTA